ncbi:hypothetical protein HF295_00935 [Hujiaoplasma nucleasis]|uniref:ECF transporter S component n=1 Tax=Hujiaoplasma nucleasis TaxID=2725268 RepID=A0A7L6MZT6_9MOLU|nr:hypothetical protein [Hujiaoplasma nucleasis]QLY39500.1 hypothetical protein HF295_00935 [Hujiaoplasma nucleasis]
MKKNKIQLLAKVVLFGGFWGLLEATLGYVLHFLPMLISGTLMFPLVVFVLYRAYKSTGSRKALLFVGLVAILIKSSNLLLPFLPAAKTINPMIAMFLQSLIVFAVIPLLESKKPLQLTSGILIASLGWRIGVIAYYGVNYLITGFLSFYLQSLTSVFTFIVTDGLVSALLAIFIFVAIRDIKIMKKLDSMRINPLISAAIFAIAIILTLVKF